MKFIFQCLVFLFVATGTEAICQDTVKTDSASQMATQDTLSMDSATMVVAADTARPIDTDSAKLHMQMDQIYESAKRSFGDLKGSRTGTNDGKTVYESKIEVLHSNSNTIEVDSERSHAFTCKFDGLTLEEALEQQEKLTMILHKRLVPEGFKRGIGSNFRYYKYQLNTVEFESDNIDEMGKRPSFTIGLLEANDGSFTVELLAIDPLWK